MDNANRLLVVIDPREESEVVVSRAVELALLLDVDIELFSCYHKSIGLTAEILKTEVFHQILFDPLSKLREKLDTLADSIRPYDINVSIDAVCDAPFHEAVVRKVLRDEPRWVIKDARHKHLLHDLVFDNTDWCLIRECPCPLWLVRSIDTVAGKPVLAAIDPLHEHDKPASLDINILALAEFVSEQMKSQLHVFHAYNAMPGFMITPGPESTAVQDQIIREHIHTMHDKAMQEITADMSIPKENIHLESGSIRKCLLDIIKQLDTGLVIMGAVSRNPLKRIFIGSTAEEALQHISCDMLIVKPDWFVTSLDNTPYVKDLELIKDRKWGLKC